MNGNNLEIWYNCPYCGHEGFKEDMEHDFESSECIRYLIEIGVIEEEEKKNWLDRPSWLVIQPGHNILNK